VGLNITQIVDSLVEAETAPEKDKINADVDAKTLEISSLGTVASELNLLKTNASALANKTKLSTSSASTLNTISVINPSIAQAFSSDVTVSTLATPQTLEFTGFTSTSDNIGSGTITVDFGNWITNGTATDSDSLFDNTTTVTASTSLGTPLTHSTLGGVIRIKTEAGGDQSSTVFTVVGTDMAGNTITENITGGAGGATVTTANVFKSVTSITPGSTVGTGNVKIGHVAADFGPNTASTSSTLTIGSGTGTLTSIATSLNSITGVNASILNKGDGTYSLVVRTDTGVNNAIRMTISENSGDSGLSTFDTTSDNASHQKTAATDASLIIDGVSVNRSSNSITDLFDGYKFDLTATTTSSFRVSSQLDKTTALASLKEFIDVLNSTRTTLNELTRQGSDTVEAGPLAKNVAVKNVVNKVSSITTGAIVGYGDRDLYLSELGVRTEMDGTLTINEKTFNSQLDLDSTVFDAIFTTMFSSSSSYLKVEGSSATSSPTPGKYSYTNDGSTVKLDGISNDICYRQLWKYLFCV
jgi:flagellar capping protein FliD